MLRVARWIANTADHSHGSRIYLTKNLTCKRHLSTNLTATEAQRSTIYALSTPPGKGGVAIVRVSGPDALLVWDKMVRSHDPKRGMMKTPTPWKMQRCRIIHPENESLIDDGLAIYFRAPFSYTTKPTLELHIHSGRALIAALLSSLSLLPNLRPAEPGEFTRQALLGGRLDLTQVEGLHDLIEADTEVQRIWALGGAGVSEYDSLRTQIIHCLAQLEALIDFGEGEDIEEGVYELARAEASSLLNQIRTHLADNRRGEVVSSGIKMAIFGPPNAGKSSLFNYLANREASIVTSIPGTTRDVLQLTLDIGGLPVVVADTAGLRETDDVVEGIGVKRGIEAIKDADISLCVLPLPEILDASGREITIPPSVRPLITKNTYFLLNKCDLVSPDPNAMRSLKQSLAELCDSQMVDRTWIASITTGAGAHAFRNVHAPIITRTRHRTHLESACRFLEAFLALPPEDIVFAVEELRYAAQAVGRVTGDIGVEDVLDSVFRDFCIGK
ncbi:hypothetical protein HYPSUDRAFT_150101 [Hypholoma sublateritium FD-334 SS-4]|uniref:TrmE-type G domain-containing protein n=1 Tax=Hypholoma sublateritium (strain FD-334 SS-4) TaxID=945553 RepID=A0A0D2LV17_HYPSF|nr:hypothetical protein HYPSUDRAFT_150101 [Hypholoma sublateritium FD-334 SS-4]